jgi:tetratricopeptide (TPR) repeat protein
MMLARLHRKLLFRATPAFFLFSIGLWVVPLMCQESGATTEQTPIRTLEITLQAAAQSPGSTETSREPDALLAEAKLLVDKGRASEAERAVRQYLEKNKNSAEGHFLLGYILFREMQESADFKSGTGAAAYAEKITDGADTSIRDSKARASLAEYTEGAKYRDPRALDLKIVALDYVLLGDYLDADHWLTRSLEWNPKDSESWYYLGRTKYNENRFVEAISAFEKCLQLDPKNVKAEDNLGLSYVGLGRNEEAATAYQNAIAWQSHLLVKNSGPYINLGSLLLDANRPVEATSNLLQAAEMSPQDSKVHELLARAYSHSDQLQKAQSEMEKAVELNPKSGPLHCMLAQIYKKEGMSAKAKPEFERCASLSGTHSSPENPHP